MDEKLLLEQIDAFVAENRENVLRDLKTLVDINSVEGQPQPGAPFGPGPSPTMSIPIRYPSKFSFRAAKNPA